MELHNLGIGFLRLAASFTVASLLFGFILPKKEQIVTVVASGFAGWFYIFVTWTGVFFDGYEFLFSLIAVAHFTHCIMWALQQRQIEFFISKKPKEKFGLLGPEWFEVPIEITLRGANRPPNMGDEDFVLRYRVHNGSWRGGSKCLTQNADGDWVYFGSLLVKAGEKFLTIFDHDSQWTTDLNLSGGTTQVVVA